MFMQFFPSSTKCLNLNPIMPGVLRLDRSDQRAKRFHGAFFQKKPLDTFISCNPAAAPRELCGHHTAWS